MTSLSTSPRLRRLVLLRSQRAQSQLRHREKSRKRLSGKFADRVTHPAFDPTDSRRPMSDVARASLHKALARQNVAADSGRCPADFSPIQLEARGLHSPREARSASFAAEAGPRLAARGRDSTRAESRAANFTGSAGGVGTASDPTQPNSAESRPHCLRSVIDNHHGNSGSERRLSG